jgi:hypothetical protein
MDRNKRGEHPGWAVRYEDGSWLSYAHGFFQSTDAFYARLHATEEDAKRNAEEANEDWSSDPQKYTIVPGWEPLCESLRFEIESLKEANTLDPDTIFDVVMDLQGIISRISPTWGNHFDSEKDKE